MYLFNAPSSSVLYGLVQILGLELFLYCYNFPRQLLLHYLPAAAAAAAALFGNLGANARCLDLLGATSSYHHHIDSIPSLQRAEGMHF
jgi:hypothetical protein